MASENTPAIGRVPKERTHGEGVGMKERSVPVVDMTPDMPDGPDIWAKLARLDHCCHVSIHSLYVAGPDGAMAREWEVTIRRKGGGEAPAIVVRDRSMRDAILEAIAEADRLGWPDGPLPRCGRSSPHHGPTSPRTARARPA